MPNKNVREFFLAWKNRQFFLGWRREPLGPRGDSAKSGVEFTAVRMFARETFFAMGNVQQDPSALAAVQVSGWLTKAKVIALDCLKRQH